MVFSIKPALGGQTVPDFILSQLSPSLNPPELRWKDSLTGGQMREIQRDDTESSTEISTGFHTSLTLRYTLLEQGSRVPARFTSL